MNAHSKTVAHPVRKNLSVEETMGLTGHKDRTAFLAFVRKSAFPRIKINARLIVFDQVAINDWLRKRTIGGAS